MALTLAHKLAHPFSLAFTLYQTAEFHQRCREAQYHAVQQRAQTAEYRAVRREHPRIERKLADLIRWHNGRRVRYRGRLRVKVQYLLTAIVVNCKRIVTLLNLPLQAQVTLRVTNANGQ
jgi:IS5 family transposase